MPEFFDSLSLRHAHSFASRRPQGAGTSHQSSYLGSACTQYLYVSKHQMDSVRDLTEFEEKGAERSGTVVAETANGLDWLVGRRPALSNRTEIALDLRQQQLGQPWERLEALADIFLVLVVHVERTRYANENSNCLTWF